MDIFIAKEYEKIKCIEKPDFDFSNLNLDFPNEKTKIKFLKLHSDFKSDYYIGADWLKEKESALLVFPKIDNLDYLSMFLECLSNPYTAKEINKKRKNEKIYEISFNKPSIPLEGHKFDLTPLLIVHFLNVIKAIIKKGLKKDYIKVESNLNSKIKGKILINKTIKQNLLKANFNKTFCSYQIFTVNNKENQILKKALIFIQKYLSINKINTDTNINSLLNYCLSAFENVSNNIDIKSIKHIKTSSFFQEYKEGINLAQMILKRFGYSLNSINKNIESKIPPFYINMPLLFEVYVLLKLKKEFGNDIIYQYDKGYGETDFLDKKRKIIFDAKYKNAYINNGYDIEDIRQLSGYARDERVLKRLNIDLNNPVIVDCVIIYPDISNKKDDLKNIKQNIIKNFVKFYKYGIKMPIKKKQKAILHIRNS